ncbi:MAG: sulfatase [Deltaproteobacteria bacterium]|nr:sulfatase [Deltaproteobacteria bacterium]MBW2384531.1 sulfatase [Deltaproteobacteria bacterium]MBW2698556.1 sulfatase [Deltaproteobacteria bacterium]
MDAGRIRKNWHWIAAIVLVLVFFARMVDIRPGGDPRPVGGTAEIEALAERDDLNVIFVLIDTLRADRLGSWGYERDTSPTIDKLAATGIRFARHLAQSSWTKCSMASLWASLYPARTGVTRFDHAVSEEATLPAEIFKAAGYQTTAIYRNGWVDANFGFSQGFDVYHNPRPRPLLPSERRDNPTLRVDGTDMGAIDASASFLRAYGDQKFFLYVHLMDVHEYVYDEQSAIFGDTYSDIYDQAILRLDRILDMLIRAVWDDPELASRTVIVIASDHGEGFGERGLEGHARTVYPEVTEVPFVIALPFRLEQGIAIDSRTQNIDVWPTLLDLLGLPPLVPSDGRSLEPEILAASRGEAYAVPESIGFAHLDQTWGRRGEPPQPQIAATYGDYRLVVTNEPTPREELFDRRGDEFETKDVIDLHPALAAELREHWARYMESKPPWSEGAPSIEIDEMKLNQLRALGYSLP